MEIKMGDARSGKIVVVSHCILNVHSLEEGLALYPGLEREVVEVLISKGVGLFQMPCPEIYLHGIFRRALPKEAYDNPKVRGRWGELARNIVIQLNQFVRRGYEILGVIGAEGSPACGVSLVGKWKEGVPVRERRFPRDIVFIEGMGVFMEELKRAMENVGMHTVWLGIPGKSIRSFRPEAFPQTLERLKSLLNF